MKYTFFWQRDEKNGCFSNWFESKFTLDGFEYFCMEQYMMSQKALLFGDTSTNDQILRATTPAECKALGRKVSPFELSVWNENKQEIIKTGLRAKFSQNKDLLQALLETEDSLLVEASPLDKIWGIGITAEKAAVTPFEEWPGENLLGKALTDVRDELK